MSPSDSNGSSYDCVLLQSLMARLELQHGEDSYRDHLLASVLNPSIPLSSTSSNSEGDSGMSFIAGEESKVEKEVVRAILAGDTRSLLPNTGRSVTIADHNICVGYHRETGSEYRVWEWHGHVMVYNELDGYSLEYIYGTYFEPLPAQKGSCRKEAEADDEGPSGDGDPGLRGLIGCGTSGNGRILRRTVSMDMHW